MWRGISHHDPWRCRCNYMHSIHVAWPLLCGSLYEMGLRRWTRLCFASSTAWLRGLSWSRMISKERQTDEKARQAFLKASPGLVDPDSMWVPIRDPWRTQLPPRKKPFVPMNRCVGTNGMRADQSPADFTAVYSHRPCDLRRTSNCTSKTFLFFVKIESPRGPLPQLTLLIMGS